MNFLKEFKPKNKNAWNSIKNSYKNKKSINKSFVENFELSENIKENKEWILIRNSLNLI